MSQITLVEFGNARTIDIDEDNDETLAQALEKAGVDSDAIIRFRGETVSGEGLEVVLTPGETVVAAPPRISHG